MACVMASPKTLCDAQVAGVHLQAYVLKLEYYYVWQAFPCTLATEMSITSDSLKSERRSAGPEANDFSSLQ